MTSEIPKVIVGRTVLSGGGHREYKQLNLQPAQYNGADESWQLQKQHILSVLKANNILFDILKKQRESSKEGVAVVVDPVNNVLISEYGDNTQAMFPHLSLTIQVCEYYHALHGRSISSFTSDGYLHQIINYYLEHSILPPFNPFEISPQDYLAGIIVTGEDVQFTLPLVP